MRNSYSPEMTALDQIKSLPQTGTKFYGMPYADDDRYTDFITLEQIKTKLTLASVQYEPSVYANGIMVSFAREEDRYNVFVVPVQSQKAMKLASEILKFIVEKKVAGYWLKKKSNRYMLFKVIFSVLENVDYD